MNLIFKEIKSKQRPIKDQHATYFRDIEKTKKEHLLKFQESLMLKKPKIKKITAWSLPTKLEKTKSLESIKKEHLLKLKRWLKEKDSFEKP